MGPIARRGPAKLAGRVGEPDISWHGAASGAGGGRPPLRAGGPDLPYREKVEELVERSKGKSGSTWCTTACAAWRGSGRTLDSDRPGPPAGTPLTSSVSSTRAGWPSRSGAWQLREL
jgi:hypothetical protein